MAKPFQITLIPDAKPLKLTPGWHRRGLTAAKRAAATARTVAPQRGDPRADAKAVDYALWLAARDGVAVPSGGAVARVDWQPCAHGVRPCAVEWFPDRQNYRPAARGMTQPARQPLLRIELPHWDYEAPPVVETTLSQWAPPVVTELPAADHAALLAILDPCEPVAVAEPCEPAPVAVAGNDDTAPVPPPAGPGAALAPVETAEAGHVEPLAVCPAVGMPCKPDCGFRAGCGRPVEAEAGAEACPVTVAEAAPRPADAAPAPLATLISAGTIVVPDLNTRRRRAPRPPVMGIPGGVLPASIMRQVIPGLARCPAPLLSAASF